MDIANIWKKSEQGFSSESRNKMRRRRADLAKTISLHHHTVGGDLKMADLALLN